MKRISALMAAFALIALATTAMAAPKVDLETIVEKQEMVETDGQRMVRFVPAAEALPGDILRFTLRYGNSGDETATGVVLDNPISEGTLYLVDTATRTGVDELLFSIDGGTSYKKPALLTYEITNPDGTRERRVASPEDYTNIRWQLPPLPAGAAGSVSFDVKVK